MPLTALTVLRDVRAVCWVPCPLLSVNSSLVFLCVNLRVALSCRVQRLIRKRDLDRVVNNTVVLPDVYVRGTDAAINRTALVAFRIVFSTEASLKYGRCLPSALLMLGRRRASVHRSTANARSRRVNVVLVCIGTRCSATLLQSWNRYWTLVADEPQMWMFIAKFFENAQLVASKEEESIAKAIAVRPNFSLATGA